MGMFLRQDEQRSEIQTRVAAELEERLRTKPTIETADVDPTASLEGHETRKAGMIIIVLLFLLVLAVVALAIKLSL